MSIYDINGNIVSSGGFGDSYFEVVNEVTGNKLQPKAEYQSGYYRGMMLNTYFKTFFGENFSLFSPNLATMQTKGKSLFVAGDSIHAYAGGDGFAEEGFITDYNKYLGFKTIVNGGYAGQTMSSNDIGGGVYYAKKLIAEGIPYDVFLFSYGGNDDANGIGTVDDEASDTALTLASSTKWIIENLRSAFPKSAIGFTTPFLGSNKDTTVQRNLIMEICKKENIPYVDMGLYISQVDLFDGSHLGVGGTVKYGSAEAKFILEICPYGEPLQ